MPNHVTHRVIVTGPQEQIDAFKARCIVAESEEVSQIFNFDTLIPMPDAIKNTTSGSCVSDGFAILAYRGVDVPRSASTFGRTQTIKDMLAWPWIIAEGEKLGHAIGADELVELLLKRSPNCVEQAETAIKNVELYGFGDWYGWSNANWGTKWNAYSFSDSAPEAGIYEFRFDTAWGSPMPIFDALAHEFPALKFDVVGFDEGWNFAVEGEIADGMNGVDEVEATDELYEEVYGEPPEHDEDDSEEDVG